MKKINFEEVIPKFDAILSRGLCFGVGRRDGQMCIEAAICAALELPHGDDPQCVTLAVRAFKIRLNDAAWSSAEARAKGLRDLGIAQIGSKGVVNDIEFTKKLLQKTIKVLIPTLFRDIFKGNEKCLAAADRCETESSADAAYYAADAARYAEGARYAVRYAADAACYAADAARYAADAAADAAYYAADAARYAADAAVDADKYLLLSAKIALETLIELKSPGCEWITK